MKVGVHKRADDDARGGKRGRRNKQQEGDEKVKMLASGDKEAVQEEVQGVGGAIRGERERVGI